MHYVSHGKEPESLSLYREEYTQGWIDYVDGSKRKESKSKQPSDRKWADDEVRGPLIHRFRKSCAYCGIGIGETLSVTGEMIPYGQVDHYWPKSKYPKKVYQWNNLYWCCKDCNQRKGDYADEKAMIFNPANLQDTQSLILRENGRFEIRDKALSANPDSRFRQTQVRTLINATVRVQERERIIGDLKNIVYYITEISPLLKIEKISSEKNEKVESFLLLQSERLKKLLNNSNNIRTTRYLLAKVIRENPTFREFYKQHRLNI